MRCFSLRGRASSEGDLGERALARLAGEGKLRAVGLDQRLGERQAEAGALHLAALGHDAAEGFERVTKLVLGHADAGVLDPQLQFALGRDRRRQRHLPPGIGELDGVRDEIEHDLPHRAEIGDDVRKSRRERLAQHHACGRRLLLQHFRRVIGHVAQVHGGEVQLELAGLDFGQVEQVIDERQEMRAAGVDVLHVATVLLVVDLAEAAKPHDFREAHDGVERRSELVADAGEKLGFLAARRLGALLGLAQFGFGLLPLGDVAHHGAEGGLRARRLQPADRQEQGHRSALADLGRHLAPVVEDRCETGP